MKISKKDAYTWFEYFSEFAYDTPLTSDQMEIVYSTFSQIERKVNYLQQQKISKLKNAHTLKHHTLYVGNDTNLSTGCVSCLTGTGLTAIRKTNRCNINCKFCYNFGELDQIEPVGEGLWEISGNKFYLDDIPLLLQTQKKPDGICYVFLEPFMEIEKYYDIIKIFADAGVYQHMYTNGLLANEDNLKKLAEAGLNELRFNLGGVNTSSKVIDNMALAKRYIPYVGIETPMTPEFFESFHQNIDAILAANIDFVNCAELHLNPNNIDNYADKNLYISRLGYISPIESRLLSLDLMIEAEANHWPFVVHDCSNQTKFARGLNEAAKRGERFGAVHYGSEFDVYPYAYFLNVLNDSDFNFLEEEPLPKKFNMMTLDAINFDDLVSSQL